MLKAVPRSSLERTSISSTSSASPTKNAPASLAMPVSSPSLGESIAFMAPMPSALPPGQFSPVPTTARSSLVRIQPRPLSANDVQVMAPSPTQLEGPPVKKRRGRPPRKPIEYSMPNVAPKAIAPLVPHLGGGHPSIQHSYSSPHPLAAPFLPTGTPPTEGSMPGTPTQPSILPPSTAVAPRIASTSGTTRGRKRARQPMMEGSTAEAGERMIPSGDFSMQPIDSEGNEGQLSNLQHTSSAAHHVELEARMITTMPSRAEIADASAPRYVPDDRSLSIPERGPTLAPLARGEPSTQPNNTTKRDRPTPLTP